MKKGTSVRIGWPHVASSMLADAKDRFLQICEDYTWLNPHLTLTVKWMGDAAQKIKAIDPKWTKWVPSDPTSPHWYGVEHLKRLIGACVADDRDNGRDRTVREMVSQFCGLSGTAKQRQVLEATGLAREKLSALVTGNTLDDEKVKSLLAAMQANSKRIKPADLGVIGRDNLMRKFESVGCEMKSFNYRKTAVERDNDDLPCVQEMAFGWLGDNASRYRRILGVNWSPGLRNPFRELGSVGESLDSMLAQQRIGRDEPVILFMHGACPRVEYTDRGKSAVVIRGVSDDRRG